MNILAVILARGGSKGIPKKNIYLLCGHPLIAYSIYAGLQSQYITDLVVSTDSEEIASVAKSYGALVPFMRPAEFATDSALSAGALLHALEASELALGKRYDYVIELPCVAPLRDATHIDGAIHKIVSSKCDSVISVVSTGEKHPIRLKKIVDDQIVNFCEEYPEPEKGSRRQDLLPEAFIRNGAMYLMTRNVLVDGKGRSGKDSRPYVMPPECSINIDEMFDMRVVEMLISQGKCLNKPHKKRKILITTPLDFINDMRKEFTVLGECVFAERPTQEEMIELVRDVDVLICQPCPEYVIGEDILLNTRLSVIASTSTGTNHIDTEFCENNKIDVISLKDSKEVSNIKASSEFTFGLVLSLVRKINLAMYNVSLGLWRENENIMRGIELDGKTLGIIGFGRIGSNNAKYARAFGMNVVAYDPYVVIDETYVRQKNNYQEVLQEADVVMICVHLDKNTEGMVSSDWFDLMRDGVYFINTSRGAIVDEAALIHNLDTGKVAGAAVDVITNEQERIDEHPMVMYSHSHYNLIVTPHIAGLTYDSERKAAGIILNLLKEYFV